MPIKVDPNSIGVLQSRPPNPFTPKLSNSQFGPNGSIWKFLAYTLVYPSEGGGGENWERSTHKPQKLGCPIHVHHYFTPKIFDL